MKFFRKYTFVRLIPSESDNREDMVVMYDNDAQKSFVITHRRYKELRGYFDFTLYIHWEPGEKNWEPDKD
jgi:hypothetical protein